MPERPTTPPKLSGSGSRIEPRVPWISIGWLEWRKTSHDAPKVTLAPPANSKSDSTLVGVPTANRVPCFGPAAVISRSAWQLVATAWTRRIGPIRLIIIVR